MSRMVSDMWEGEVPVWPYIKKFSVHHKHRKEFSQEVRLLPSHYWHRGRDNSCVYIWWWRWAVCTANGTAPLLSSANNRSVCKHQGIFLNRWRHLLLRNAIVDEGVCRVCSKKVSVWRLVTPSWVVLPWDEEHRKRRRKRGKDELHVEYADVQRASKWKQWTRRCQLTQRLCYQSM